jgi:hypothetical protein
MGKRNLRNVGNTNGYWWDIRHGGPNLLIFGIAAHRSIYTCRSNSDVLWSHQVVVSVCVNGLFETACGGNDTWGNVTSVAFRSSILTADVSYNIANNSIIAVSNLSTPTYQNVTPMEYFQAFESMFGPQYRPNMTSDPMSTFSSFIRYLVVDFGAPYQQFATVYPDLVSFSDTLVLLLTIPLLVFQPTLNDGVDGGDEPMTGFWPTIELAEMCTLQSIPTWAVIVYIVIASLIFLWCIGGIVLSLFVDESPATSNFDLVDFTAATTANRLEGSLAETFASLPFGKHAEIRKRLEDKSVYVRHLGGTTGAESDDVEEIAEDHKIGFTTDGGQE